MIDSPEPTRPNPARRPDYQDDGDNNDKRLIKGGMIILFGVLFLGIVAGIWMLR